MSEIVLQNYGNSLDPYLRQLVPLLETCKQTVHKITQRDLTITGKDRGVLFFNFTIEIGIYAQQSGIYAQGCGIDAQQSGIDAQQSGVHAQQSGIYALQSGVDAQQSGIHAQQNQRVRSRNPSGTNVKEALNVIEQGKVFTDKLRDVVSKLIIAEKEMKTESSTLSRKLKKLTELKKSLDELTRHLDRIVTFYNAKILGFHPKVDLPALEDVKQLNKQLRLLNSSLTEGELVSLFASYDAAFSTSNEVIICTILGLSDDYGYWLQELDTDMLMHQPLLYHLQKSIENEESELEADGSLCVAGKQALAENLHKLGFNKETAKIITQHIPDEFADLQKPSYWAVRYLDHAFRLHPLLCNGPRYLQNEHLLDEWCNIMLPFDSGEITDSEIAQLALNETRKSEDARLVLKDTKESKDARLCAVRMINISSEKSHGNVLVGQFLKELKDDENFRIVFHGTTHESAMSVIAHGIILTRGSKEQDFSNGDGFYVSEKFDNAKAWSRAARGDHGAVIVYKVIRSLLNPDENNGLDLSQDVLQWQEVVRCCRNGYRNRKCRKAFEKYAFIQGPPCKNPRDVQGSNPLLPCEESGNQLCIRDDSFAEDFGSLNNVACVIFY